MFNQIGIPIAMGALASVGDDVVSKAFGEAEAKLKKQMRKKPVEKKPMRMKQMRKIK